MLACVARPPGIWSGRSLPSCLACFPSHTLQGKAFRFFNFWAEHSDFFILFLMERAWNLHCRDTPMFWLTVKHEPVKDALKAFNFKNFINLERKVVGARDELSKV